MENNLTNNKTSVLDSSPIDPTLLDNVFALWENLDNNDNPQLVEACVYFITRYGFDADLLPEDLYVAVQHERSLQAMDTIY